MKSFRKLALVAGISAALVSGNALAAKYVFVEENSIEKSRTLLHSDQAPESMKRSYERLLEEAELAMQDGPFTVTDKTLVPPSGTKNDYMSISPYWWPDETKEDGLPWIRKDGKTNPVSKTADTDSRRIGHFTRSVRALAIAYYFSGEEKYAEQAISYLNTWFLDPETRMNPNVNFGQSVPGVADGRRSGLIDTRSFSDRLLDSFAMLSGSPAWTDEVDAGIDQWFGEYLDWLVTAPLAGGPKGEAYAENNHGTFYDLQVAGISYYLGNDTLAKQAVSKGKMRIETQIEKDGSQPHEIARTRAYHYHYFNIDAMAGIAQVGDKVGVDMWNYQGSNGGSLESTIQLMANYHDPEADWPYTAKDKRRRVERMVPIYRKAGMALDNGEFLELADTTDFTKFNVKKNLAEVWAERDVELLYRVH